MPISTGSLFVISFLIKYERDARLHSGQRVAHRVLKHCRRETGFILYPSVYGIMREGVSHSICHLNATCTDHVYCPLYLTLPHLVRSVMMGDAAGLYRC